jgi:DNA polymerase III subunit delta
MGIVNSSVADGFIERLESEFKFYLVHGSDEGLVYERSRAIVRKILGADPGQLRLVRLDGDEIAREPALLANEAYAISMFGGSRVIWIDAQARDLFPALSPLFARPPADCTIVIKAGQLRKGTSLRDAFEQMPGLASLECHPEGPNTLGPFIDAEARTAALKLAPDAKAALLALLGSDHKTTRAELSKLMLYARGRTRVEIEDVEAIASNGAFSTLDDLVDQTLRGDLCATASLAVRFSNEGGDFQQYIVRIIIRLTLLYQLRLEMDRGRSFDAACQASFLRLPNSSKKALSDQARRLTSDLIAVRLPEVRAVGARLRAEPYLSAVIAIHTAFELASGFRFANR